ncbi:hypothetical protein DFQ27_002459 [Actinomortierella ambigua]|uniref:G-protein coupled receptors family 2 profile 2 domain-containing protein n=1 Tax=Actinomortierella ambigua TaxID=1343610 RepID=A0A9P6Q9J7_9FUNG|nr:hypothetical protein DFQ27_002459 [Actinomortierella ambigua]
MAKVAASAPALQIAKRVWILVALVCLTAGFVAGQAQPPSAKPTAPTNPSNKVPSATPTTVFIIPSSPPPMPSTPPPAPSGLPDFTKMFPMGTTRCPAPLVPNRLNITSKTCLSGCCLKCPIVENFYAPNEMNHIVVASYYVRNVSLAFTAFLALSYLILPGKRAQPHISVLFLTLSLMLWYISMDVMDGTSNACINELEQSTGRNSVTCGFQGAAITYLTHTSALWCSLLIYKLHLLAVWRSDWIDRHYRWCVVFCWILPVGFAIPIIAMRLQEYPGIGFSCLVKVEELNTYIFYPVAVYMYPAFMCHIITVVKMVQLAVMSSKVDTGMSQLSANAQMKITTTMQAKRLLRGQWRPAFMLGAVLTSLTVFWMFYFIDAHKLVDMGPTTVWLQQWIACVLTSNKLGLAADDIQRSCATQITTHLPSITWFTAAEMLLALLGVVVGLVFMSKADFWSEWHFLLYNLLTRGKSGSSSQGRRSPGAGGGMSGGRGGGGVIGGGMGGIGSSPTPVYDSHLHEFEMNHRANSAARSTPHKGAEFGRAPNGTQWYDMDDLLDKEYDDRGTNKSTVMLNRYPSDGSRKTLHTGDILYSPPVAYDSKDDGVNGGIRGTGGGGGWTPSPHLLTSPTKAYLTPVRESGDRYMDEPVVPAPVPRISRQTPTRDFNTPPHSPTSNQPVPRQFGPAYTSEQDADVVFGVATRGSAAIASSYQHYQQGSPPLQGFPTSPPTLQQSPTPTPKARIIKTRTSGETADGRAMVGGGGGLGVSPRVMTNTNISAGGPGSPSQQRAKSPPPYVPMKSPARTQYGSGPIHLSTPH